MQDESKTKAQLIEELEQTRKRVAEFEQAEEALRESEEKYRTIFENVHDQIVYLNKYGTIISANDHEETYGRKPEEIIGKHFTKLGYFDVKDIPKYLKLFKDVITGKETIFLMEIDVKHKDGHKIPVEISTSLMKSRGKVNGFLCIVRDITERKRAEEALREREERYRTVVEDMPALICRFRPDGTLSFVNSAYCQYFGKTYEELIGHNFFNFIPDEDREKVRDHYNSINKKRPAITYEHQVITPDGTIRWQRWTDRGLFYRNGTLGEYQSIGEDITDRKQAEAKLETTQEQLRNLSRHLQSIREEDRAILAREIHDQLGQALTILKFGLVELKNALPADQIPLVEKTTSMAEYIDTTAEIVNRIATQLRPTLLDELGMMEAIEWETEEFENRTGIKCELTLEPEEIEVDRDRSTAIYRIVQEALTNIARHAQATRSTVSLKISDGRLLVSITDNGIGIAEDKILDPKSLGIIGMRERVLTVGGDFEINRMKKSGTKIMVTIPVEDES